MKDYWIKLFPKIKEWEWYKDGNTFRLFIHLLLSANWKDAQFEGVTVKRGSLITGRKKLEEDLNISAQSIRTSLNKLKSTNNIKIETTNKYSLITIINYAKYQTLTFQQPTTNQQLTTIEEEKTIISFINNNYARTLSAIEYETILSWLKFFKSEVINLAIKVSCDNNAKTAKYADAVLRTWYQKGFKTYEECFEYSYPKPKENNQEPVKELFDYNWLDEEEGE